jgi:uncharacterized membrane protein
MTRRSLVCLTAILALGICSLPATASQQTTYRLTLIWNQVIDARGGGDIRIGGLNDKGAVAVTLDDQFGLRAFVWHDGEIQEVGFSLLLLGLNDRSQVVGFDISGPDHAHAFVWRDGNLVFLQARSGEPLFSAADINNRGQAIVGYLDPQGNGHAIWRRGVLTRLDPPPGLSAAAGRLNNRGVVVGTAGAGPGTNSVPVMWQDGTVMQIELPPGAIGGSGNDINDRGTVVAHADFPAQVGESFGHIIAYVWKDGEITLLPPLTSEQQNSTAGSINNRGVVVGSSSTNPGQTFRADATIWRRGRAADLNDLICDEDPLKPFVHLESAEHINNRGQIVARGKDSRQPNNSSSLSIKYYLLTPEH